MPSGSTPTWRPSRSCGTRGTWPSFRASAIRTRSAPTSARWISGTPVSPTRSAPGWLGRAIRDIDPHKENVLTGVNFGRGLPRALAAPGVPVASVGNLETYGVLTGIEGADQRSQALDLFAKMYSSKLGSSLVREYISQTGYGCLERGRHPQHGTAEVYLDGEVRRYRVAIHAHSPRCIWLVSAPRSCTPPLPRTASIPTPPRWRNTPVVAGRVQCCQRVLPGPEGAQRQRQRRGLAVHGVWPAGA